MARLIHCAECGRNRPHHGKGLCKRCWSRQYYEAHRAERLEYNCQYYAEHRKALAENRRRRYAAHLEEVRERSREWAKANPDKVRENKRRRRALKNGATIGPVDEAAIYERDGRMCIYCGAVEDLTLDHLIPLLSGGAHSEDNLAVACGPCNSSKQATALEDWLQTKPRALAWVI